MKPVVQLEKTGCGIACAAAIAGISYANAKSEAASLGICASDSSLWSDPVHVRKLLRYLGFRASSRKIPFRSWSALPKLALLSIKWHVESGRPYWHWVVYVREESEVYVLDSKMALRNNKRKDFGRIKPKWYIAVSSAPQTVAADAASRRG